MVENLSVAASELKGAIRSHKYMYIKGAEPAKTTHVRDHTNYSNFCNFCDVLVRPVTSNNIDLHKVFAIDVTS